MIIEKIIKWLLKRGDGLDEKIIIFRVSNDYSWIIEKRLLKDYLKIIINDYRKIIEKIIEKGGGVGLKNGHLPLTDILPPEGDSGLGLPIFFGETIYTWTQFE